MFVEFQVKILPHIFHVLPVAWDAPPIRVVQLNTLLLKQHPQEYPMSIGNVDGDKELYQGTQTMSIAPPADGLIILQIKLPAAIQHREKA